MTMRWWLVVLTAAAWLLAPGGATGRSWLSEGRAFGAAEASIVAEGGARMPGEHTVHPCLFATAEEIARARERARKYEWAKAVYDGVIASADQALNETVAVPNTGGQWTHYYSCPKHGVRLVTESPTRHVCPFGGEVYSGWPFDDVVVSFTHHRYTSQLQDLGLAYALTGEQRYAQRARDILLAYAEKYPRYRIHDVRGGDARSGGKRFAQTLDEAVDLVRVAWAYDLICGVSGIGGGPLIPANSSGRGSLGAQRSVQGIAAMQEPRWNALSAQEREVIERDFLRPSVEVISRNRAGKSNWQSWHNAGMAAVGFCLGDEAMVHAALDDPQNGFRYQMQASVLCDGSWYEGAPSYHFYALAALVYTVEAAARSGIKLYENPRYRALFDAPLGLVYPDLTLPALNDADRFSLGGQQRLYEAAYARFGDKRYAAVIDRGNRQSIEALLWGADRVPADATLRLESVNLDGLGCAILRDDGEPNGRYLLLDYGPHGGGHGHPEKLQIVFYGLGQELAPDAGRLAYSVPLHRTWYRQTLAHNTIVVDEKSQAPTEGKLVLFHRDAGFQAVRAVATEAYEGVALDRTVIMTPGYVLDVFRAHSERPHTYDWVYHNAGRVRYDGEASALRMPLAREEGYQHLGGLRRAEVAGTWRAVWEVEGGQVRLTAADGCGPAEVFLADAPGQPPTTRMPLVICRRKGEGAAFVSVIELARRGHRVQSAALKGWVGRPGAKGLSVEVVTSDGADTFWIADDAAGGGAQIVYVPAGGKKRTAP
jgi:hypothetical protein